MVRKGLNASMRALIGMASHIFRLPETGARILEAMVVSKKAFTVKDLVRIVKRSERSVRAALDLLVSKGVLIRKVSLTGRKRLSYMYTLGPMERVIKVIRSEILNQLESLERIEGQLTGPASP